MSSPCTKLALGVLLALGVFSPAVAAGEIAVIVHASNPNSTLSLPQVKACFLKTAPAWSNREKVRPVDHTDTDPDRRAFVSRVLGMSVEDFDRFWIEKQYASAESPPTKLPDDAAVIKFVTTFKGAIGFVDAKSVPAGSADVRTILTLAF